MPMPYLTLFSSCPARLDAITCGRNDRRSANLPLLHRIFNLKLQASLTLRHLVSRSCTLNSLLFCRTAHKLVKYLNRSITLKRACRTVSRSSALESQTPVPLPRSFTSTRELAHLPALLASPFAPQTKCPRTLAEDLPRLRLLHLKNRRSKSSKTTRYHRLTARATWRTKHRPRPRQTPQRSQMMASN